MARAERVLVCGGRDFVDSSQIWGELDTLHRWARQGCMVVIQGGASGADRIAREWCISRLVRFENYPAKWSEHGKAAGPIRNQRMLDVGRPDLVLAFNGGRGTADMVRRAKAAGVPVRIVPPHFGALSAELGVFVREGYGTERPVVEGEGSRDRQNPSSSNQQKASRD